LYKGYFSWEKNIDVRVNYINQVISSLIEYLIIWERSIIDEFTPSFVLEQQKASG